jgi:predicted Ser/Thr protein kinase
MSGSAVDVYNPNSICTLYAKIGDKKTGVYRKKYKFAKKKCFWGHAFINWLLQNTNVKERSEAFRYGRFLLDNELVLSVGIDVSEIRESEFYYFASKEKFNHGTAKPFQRDPSLVSAGKADGSGPNLAGLPEEYRKILASGKEEIELPIEEEEVKDDWSVWPVPGSDLKSDLFTENLPMSLTLPVLPSAGRNDGLQNAIANNKYVGEQSSKTVSQREIPDVSPKVSPVPSLNALPGQVIPANTKTSPPVAKKFTVMLQPGLYQPAVLSPNPLLTPPNASPNTSPNSTQLSLSPTMSRSPSPPPISSSFMSQTYVPTRTAVSAPSTPKGPPPVNTWAMPTAPGRKSVSGYPPSSNLPQKVESSDHRKSMSSRLEPTPELLFEDSPFSQTEFLTPSLAQLTITPSSATKDLTKISEDKSKSYASGMFIVEDVVRDKLGEGNFGVAYVAKEVETSRKCVVKELKLGDERDAKKRQLFGVEIELNRKLGGICRRIPELLYAEDAFFVQEYIPGQSLDKMKGTFKPTQVIKMLSDIAEVIKICHNEGILHRDIKPGNIIAKKTGAEEFSFYLIDFGIAKQLQNDALISGTMIGTPAYIAPEVGVIGATYASDIFSLGVTAIHLLIDPKNVSDPTPMSLLKYLYLHKLIDFELCFVLSKMIEFDPKMRVGNCSHLQDLCKSYTKWASLPKYSALEYFAGERPNLKVYKGDLVAVLDSSQPSWLCICRGQTGYVPKEKLVNDNKEANPAVSNN